ncbi:MAG: hypothetical protein WDN28_15100 [Chthoniobacter sp.]
MNNNLAPGRTRQAARSSTGTGRIVLLNGVTITGETIHIIADGGNNWAPFKPRTTLSPPGRQYHPRRASRLGPGVGGTPGPFRAVISGPFGVFFSRANNSTTILNGVNTYTGDTQIFANAGTGDTLKIGVDNAIGAAPSRLTTIGTAATVRSTLDLNGHILTLRAVDTSTLQGNGAVLFISNNAAAPSPSSPWPIPRRRTPPPFPARWRTAPAAPAAFRWSRAGTARKSSSATTPTPAALRSTAARSRSAPPMARSVSTGRSPPPPSP